MTAGAFFGGISRRRVWGLDAYGRYIDEPWYITYLMGNIATGPGGCVDGRRHCSGDAARSGVTWRLSGSGHDAVAPIRRADRPEDSMLS